MPLTPEQASKPRKRSGKEPGAAAPERPRPPKEAEIEAERRRKLRERGPEPDPDYDAIDEAGIESFPASDPPAFIGATI